MHKNVQKFNVAAKSGLRENPKKIAFSEVSPLKPSFQSPTAQELASWLSNNFLLRKIFPCFLSYKPFTDNTCWSQSPVTFCSFRRTTGLPIMVTKVTFAQPISSFNFFLWCFGTHRDLTCIIIICAIAQEAQMYLLSRCLSGQEAWAMNKKLVSPELVLLEFTQPLRFTATSLVIAPLEEWRNSVQEAKPSASGN